jgi:hypothetical protein
VDHTEKSSRKTKFDGESSHTHVSVVKHVSGYMTESMKGVTKMKVLD